MAPSNVRLGLEELLTVIQSLADDITDADIDREVQAVRARPALRQEVAQVLRAG